MFLKYEIFEGINCIAVWSNCSRVFHSPWHRVGILSNGEYPSMIEWIERERASPAVISASVWGLLPYYILCPHSWCYEGELNGFFQTKNAKGYGTKGQKTWQWSHSWNGLQTSSVSY